jgi:hypothetical protein
LFDWMRFTAEVPRGETGERSVAAELAGKSFTLVAPGFDRWMSRQPRRWTPMFAAVLWVGKRTAARAAALAELTEAVRRVLQVLGDRLSAPETPRTADRAVERTRAPDPAVVAAAALVAAANAPSLAV